jgi:hypothetical protein
MFLLGLAVLLAVLAGTPAAAQQDSKSIIVPGLTASTLPVGTRKLQSTELHGDWSGWGKRWGGRKMLQTFGARKLLGTEQWPFFGSYNTNANSFAQATNNGFANGPVVANSNAYANGPSGGYGGWGCWWCSSSTTANSAAVATNNGVANGPVVANSGAFANGRR